LPGDVAIESQSAGDFRVLTEEIFYGPTSRWRRFGEPVPAGNSTKADGTPDYGLFGPGSQVWDVLLHPATIVFESIGQSILQLTYKPIAAGIRDHDPLSRKARAGTLTFFDAFERFQRNSGMHAPMWLGDTPTAERMAAHLHRVHQRVASDIIDIGAPELGGYAASGPRDAMWAALTEMDSMLHLYEAFAFHGSEPPRRLSAAQRDRFFAEAAAYLRLVGAPEADIPTSADDVEALYDNYDALFGHSETIDIIPETGQDYRTLSADVMKQNFHPSQAKAIGMLRSQFGELRLPVLAALRERTQRHAGLSEEDSARAEAALAEALPEIRRLQQPDAERDIMRLMWGPDGVMLIESARALHRDALAGARRAI
jgi:uncharacterized protein (DUF2236 family)